MSFSGTGSFQLEVQETQQTEPLPVFDADELIDSMLDAPLHLFVEEGAGMPDVCYLEKAHLDLLRKFHNRSVLSLGTTESVHVYQRILTQMAAQHSFVLHAVLRFVLLHDRYLYDPPGTNPSTAESFHGYHAAALFSEVLSMESHSGEVMDALWGTSALLGAGTFADIEAASAKDAWPLKVSSISDLDWLKMSEGKNAVWRLANPTRRNSQFREIVEAEQRKQQTGNTEPIDPAMEPFLHYCAALKESDVGSYHNAASIMERLAMIKCTKSTVIWYLSMLSHAEHGFLELVARKDPPALLLLAFWYAKLLQYGVWWVSRRCLFEGQAICIFLNRILSREDPIISLLEFPMSVCGINKLLEVDRDIV